jgi:uncharacterized DUF497 family protein
VPYFFYWTQENVAHLEEHDVSPEEFEEVVSDPEETDTSRTTGRSIAFGLTSTGKYLACVYEMLDETTVYPITAYEVDE